MQKVITINLNGRAYQLDEDAYELLRAYLDKARQTLTDNPDLSEIMADLEQAIADKCQKFLSPNKTVVVVAEIRQVLDAMGPVDAAPEDGKTAEAPAGPGTQASARAGDPPKRLYLIQEGAWIGGVCTGLGAFLNIDPTILRVVFIAIAASTNGVGAIVYGVLWFTLPSASTPEEHAAAHGAPFNAKEIIDQISAQAKDIAAQVTAATDSTGWKHTHRAFRREQRAQRRAWRRERRAWRRARSHRWGWYPGVASAPQAVPVGYAGQVTAGVMVPLLTLVSAAWFWIWAAAMMSLVATGAIFGRTLPSDLPAWVALLMLAGLFGMVSWPLQHARHASHSALGGRYGYGGMAAWDNMMWVGFWLFCGWYAYTHVPEVRQFFSNLPDMPDRLQDIFRFDRAR